MADGQVSRVLDALRHELRRILGHQLVAIYLFGSRARGEARADSDIDVLVVVRGDFGDLIRRTSGAVAALSLQYDVVISRVFVSQDRFAREESPFFLNVRREGVLV